MWTADDYSAQLAPVFSGRRFIVLGGAPAYQQKLSRELVRLGAERPLGLCRSPSRSPREAGDSDVLSLDVEADSLLGANRAYEAALRAPPADILESIDRFDPERRAECLGTILLSDVHGVAGRPRWADREPGWAAIEDKTGCPQFLDSIGVRRGAAAVVRADARVLCAAAARLDRGAGTVWSADNRDGVHGAADGVRWVKPDADLAAHAAKLCARADRVRIMPFYEGIPSSVHGIVLPTGTAVFRPVEQLTLRRSAGEFVYAGAATFHDPSARERVYARSLARQVGEGLRRRFGYRGAFTVDGVFSEDGFVPTEINARIGAAFQLLADALPELPLHAIAWAAQAGVDFDARPGELERLVVGAADAKRSGLALARAPGVCAGPRVALSSDGDDIGVADRGDEPTGWAFVGEEWGGGSVGFVPNPACTPVGPSVAPRVAAALAVAARVFGGACGPFKAPCPAPPAISGRLPARSEPRDPAPHAVSGA